MADYSLEEIDFQKHLDEFVKKDAILVCMSKDKKVNLIAIGWKLIGIMWSKPVITVAIRPDRYSHEVIENGEKAFTVNFGGIITEKIINFCGTKSGRSVDKVKETGLQFMESQDIKVPYIKGAHLAYECKIIHSCTSGKMSKHTLYYGEITGCYEQNPI
jgi:flavin reductase (DIM6/NTAB) family NADH-FMN oxidoreductase RutF